MQAPADVSPRPYVAAAENQREFTAKAVIFGIIFGILFGAANAYLGLRAGLTVSTSIPLAVITVAMFRIFGRFGHDGTILEANISQTTGSSSSALASGVIFTLPALFMWGIPPSLMQMTLLALAGGLLGVLFMIPLRALLIVREHGRLPFPEGTACAEVLKASQRGGSQAKNVFLGLAVGAGLKALTSWLQVIPATISFKLPLLKKAVVGVDLSGALFGVGYILGPRIASVMVGGGLLSALVIIPGIATWGANRALPLYPETVLPIAQMSAQALWNNYVRYIGAGAVAAAGIITLVRSIPMMLESFRVGLRQFATSGSADDTRQVPRTERNVPPRVLLIGLGCVLVLLAVVPQTLGAVGPFWHRAIAAVCVVIFAFFFVTVAARIVGLVGVTSNPTSGMTIAALLATATVFMMLGWDDLTGKGAALMVGCVVAIAAGISGDTSQDLKTGYLLGATPSYQQIGQLVGVLTSAVFVCLSVLLLADTFGFGTQALPAPQATLMKLVIDGVMGHSLPWSLIGIGIGIAVLCELLRIPSLAFAIGVYLPLSTMTPIFLGGLLRAWMTRKRNDETDARVERGVLLGSGLVGGEGLLGVGIAAVAFIHGARPAGFGTAWAGSPLGVHLAGVAALVALIAWFAHRVRSP
ncbi:MAG: oligopeptide transporter, OPT family [Rhodanobacter sp.]|nr:MAG: oligopeptide transporter, OPT family [Rhodanobacter sp.]